MREAEALARSISGWTQSSISRSISLVVGLALLGGCGPEEELTQPEAITVESPFEYPLALWDAELEGETVLMVHVTDVGGVDSAYVLVPSGEPAFDSAALAGAHELRFAPGRRGDNRIAMWVRLPVRFRMTDPAGGGSD